MKKILICLSLGFYACGVSAIENEQASLDNMIHEYRIYSLAKCIQGNYKKMGVDFNQLPLTDTTLGFIDIDAGLAFNAEPNNNMLDKYIESKTGSFYQPAHKKGDMAASNLVAYKCVDFYESKALKEFLKVQIPIRQAEIRFSP